MSERFDPTDDCQLIARFCAGDKSAGDRLCAGHEQKLLRSIQYLLRQRGLDLRGAVEIFQDVWLALLREDHERLKRYDPARGTFDTYLRKLARRRIEKRYGGKSRRSKREIPLGMREPLDPGGNDVLVKAELAEYLERLTHQESRCLHEELMNEPKAATEPPLSPGNQRVLKHRLEKKIRDYIDVP